MAPNFRDSLTHTYIYFLKQFFVNAFYPKAEKYLETMKFQANIYQMRVIFYSYNWDKVFNSGLSILFKVCLPQNLLSPLLNTLSHLLWIRDFHFKESVFLSLNTRQVNIK